MRAMLFPSPCAAGGGREGGTPLPQHPLLVERDYACPHASLRSRHQPQPGDIFRDRCKSIHGRLRAHILCASIPENVPGLRLALR